MIDGAGTQHGANGGFCAPAASSGNNCRGRLAIQMWSSLSMNMAGALASIQLLGSGLGHGATGLYFGTAWACAPAAAKANRQKVPASFAIIPRRIESSFAQTFGGRILPAQPI